jgi:hypothetical protein
MIGQAVGLAAMRLDRNGYSVHPTVIGRRIEVGADLARVRAHCEDSL